MRQAVATSVMLIAMVADAHPAELKPVTIRAFDGYVESAEQKMDADIHSGKFLLMDDMPAAERDQGYRELRRGEVLVTSVGPTPVHVPDGLIHHWMGAAFIPGTTLAQVFAVVRDYDHLADYYQPEIVSSRLIHRDGDHFTIFIRLRKKKIVTAVLDTEYDVHFYTVDATRAYSRSHSTRVAEVERAGEPGEHVRPVGDDHGFLWRMNSYWRFFQANDGVFVQCEAISLTRDIPAGLGWLIGPVITKIPEESLKFTLQATRRGVERRAASPAGGRDGPSRIQREHN